MTKTEEEDKAVKKTEDEKTKLTTKTKKRAHSVGQEDGSPSRSPDRSPLHSGLRLSRSSLSDPAETSTASPAH